MEFLQEDKEFEAKVIAKLEENEVDEDELIEQRRRKRQELMAKLQQEKGAAGMLRGEASFTSFKAFSSLCISPFKLSLIITCHLVCRLNPALTILCALHPA